MNDSYIVKNCPCYVQYDPHYVQNENNLYLCCGGYSDGECQDCENCIMKQIVELCEQYKKDYNTTNGVWLLANNIINLLDIQEIDNGQKD